MFITTHYNNYIERVIIMITVKWTNTRDFYDHTPVKSYSVSCLSIIHRKSKFYREEECFTRVELNKRGETIFVSAFTR